MRQKPYKKDTLEEALDLHLEDVNIDLDLESIDLIDFNFDDLDLDFDFDFSDIDFSIDLKDLDYTIEKLFKELDNVDFNIDYEALEI